MTSFLRAAFAVTALAVATISAGSLRAGIEVEKPSVAKPEKRFALVIGNDAYQHTPKLERGANDARAVGEAMAKIGFEVTPAVDLTRDDLLKAIDAFAEKLTDSDTAFVFFAGQAINIGGIDILFATDAKANDSREAFTAGVTADQIVTTLRKKQVRRIVLVIDGCRDDPFGQKFSSIPDGFVKRADWNGVFALYAAGVGQLASEALSSDSGKNEKNSVFTRIFIKALGKPGQTLPELAADVRRDVVYLTIAETHPQTPAYYDQLIDSFGYSLVPHAAK